MAHCFRWLTSTWTCWWNVAVRTTCRQCIASTRSSIQSWYPAVTSRYDAGQSKSTCSRSTTFLFPFISACTGALRLVSSCMLVNFLFHNRFLYFFVWASESWCKWTDVPSIRTLMVVEETWGPTTSCMQCFMFCYVLWQCCLCDWKDIWPYKLCHLCPKIIFQKTWRK